VVVGHKTLHASLLHLWVFSTKKKQKCDIKRVFQLLLLTFRQAPVSMCCYVVFCIGRDSGRRREIRATCGGPHELGELDQCRPIQTTVSRRVARPSSGCLESRPRASSAAKCGRK